ncbi:hypothetical protein G5C46_30300, partial [Burkholderia pseudomallei]|uniref:hypothetical protein n=1 Tax=Burkholderia pseudomallei TaxID=28450 RepID=UPI00168BE786
MRIAEALCARIVETRVDASAARPLPGSGAVTTARASTDISGLVRLAGAGGVLWGMVGTFGGGRRMAAAPVLASFGSTVRFAGIVGVLM